MGKGNNKMAFLSDDNGMVVGLFHPGQEAEVKYPGSHGWHAISPLLLAKYPGRHGEHNALATLADTVPAAHAVQLVEPSSLENP